MPSSVHWSSEPLREASELRRLGQVRSGLHMPSMEQMAPARYAMRGMVVTAMAAWRHAAGSGKLSEDAHSAVRRVAAVLPAAVLL